EESIPLQKADALPQGCQIPWRIHPRFYKRRSRGDSQPNQEGRTPKRSRIEPEEVTCPDERDQETCQGGAQKNRDAVGPLSQRIGPFQGHVGSGCQVWDQGG